MVRMKQWTHSRYLWTRTIGSTIVGEGIDTCIFVAVAFYGVFSNDVLMAILLSNYIFKVGIEVFFTPVTYLIIGKMKEVEES